MSEPSRKQQIMEALWFVATAMIGILLLLVLNKSGELMAAHVVAPLGRIPGFYWVLTAIFLALCASIPFLLKGSEPASFKWSAIVLTALAPAVALAFVVTNLWQATH